MGYPRKSPPQPQWVTIKGIVVNVYEKSLIYSVPSGNFRKRVRFPLSCVKGEVRPDDQDIQLAGWFAHKQGFTESKPMVTR